MSILFKFIQATYFYMMNNPSPTIFTFSSFIYLFFNLKYHSYCFIQVCSFKKGKLNSNELYLDCCENQFKILRFLSLVSSCFASVVLSLT